MELSDVKVEDFGHMLRRANDSGIDKSCQISAAPDERLAVCPVGCLLERRVRAHSGHTKKPSAW